MRKFSVLLVDDEPFVRQGLRVMMDWEERGYAVCGEAGEGETALLLIRELAPDLVMTDIRMPVMDGLELIRRTRETVPKQPEFVILSGYDDFNYAQTAIRYQVKDFVLKPIDEGELAGVLDRLHRELSKRRDVRASTRLGEPFWRQLTGGRWDERLDAQARASGLDPAGTYCCAFAACDAADAAWTETADAYLREYGGALVHGGSSGEIGLILPADWLADAGDGRRIGRFHAALAGSAGRPVTIRVGRPAAGLQRFRASFESADELLKEAFYREEGGIVEADGRDTAGLRDRRHAEPVSPAAGLPEAIENNDASRITELLEGLFEQYRQDRIEPEIVKTQANELILGTLDTLRLLDPEQAPEQEAHRTIRELNRQPYCRGVQELVERYCLGASQLIIELRRKQTGSLIRRIDDYVSRHFRSSELNLKRLSEEFYVNPVYLGQLLKKYYGVYFNDHLHRLRIEEAKRLLRRTECRIYEIADRIGYRNADYFISKFEKLAGMTPSQYRKTALSRDDRTGAS